MSSPFVFGKIATGSSFVNREKERKRIIHNFTAGVNTMLISPRRWGKSSLIRQAANECMCDHKNIRFVFIDLFAIQNEHEFFEVYLTEILKAADTKLEAWIKTAKEFLKQIIPVFSFGINDDSSLKLTLEWEQIKKNTSEILSLPEKIAKSRNCKFVICIDEFQKCTQFEDSSNFQQKLRSVWQLQQHCSYVLYGSKRHIVMELFESQSMPFYRFGDLLYLEKIEKEHWIPYIRKAFLSGEKEVSEAVAEKLVDRVNNHPFYVQQLAHQVWINAEEIVNEETIEAAIEELLRYNSVMYYRETEQLTNLQLSLLHAIADGQSMYFSKEVLTKYNLGTPGNIQRIKEGLEKKEVIDFFGKTPLFIDPLYEVWLNRNLFK